MRVKTPTEDLLHRLSTAVVPLEDADRAEERRARMVLRLAELTAKLPAERQRTRRLRFGTGLACAAALTIVAGYGWSRRQHMIARQVDALRSADAPGSVVALAGPVQILHQASQSPAAPNERVAVSSADEVVTGEGAHARASLESGAEVDIDPDSRVRLASGGIAVANSGAREVRNEAVALTSGRVEVRVPKLGPTRTLSVETAEATVVVHGTKFSVERRRAIPGVLPRTSVEVTEGSVSVRHDGIEVLLHAGDRWSSAQSTSVAQETATPNQPSGAPMTSPSKMRPAPPNARSLASSTAPSSTDESGASRPNGSSLAAENRLLQAAMAARQEGNPRRAAALAAELVARYPGSPLLEEARVERLRSLFAAGGASAAEAEARAYLLDFPNGFAQKEARRILGQTSTP